MSGNWLRRSLVKGDDACYSKKSIFFTHISLPLGPILSLISIKQRAPSLIRPSSTHPMSSKASILFFLSSVFERRYWKTLSWHRSAADMSGVMPLSLTTVVLQKQANECNGVSKISFKDSMSPLRLLRSTLVANRLNALPLYITILVLCWLENRLKIVWRVKYIFYKRNWRIIYA